MSDMVREWYEAQKNIDEMKYSKNRSLKKWEAKVAEGFPAKANILDIGCGLGREAFALSDMGFSVTGIDISHEVIRQVSARSAERGYSIPFAVYDGYSLPFGPDSFDAVIIWSQTFGLMYGDESKKRMLSECMRVLTAGGTLSYSGHEYRYIAENYGRYLVGKKFYPYADTEVYWEAFEPNELASFAENAGFKRVLCESGEIYKPEDGTVLHCLCRK